MGGEPKNGLYLTDEDFEQWQDQFPKLLGECQIEPIKNITFVVTENCNLACTYCYETHKTNRRMTRETAKEAIDFIFNEEKVNGYYDLDSCPGVILDIIGGEPLLEIDLINFIVEYFKVKAFGMGHCWATNYMVSISSNGTLYPTKKVQDFLARNQGKVSFGISIDGNKELHNACRIFPDGSGSYDAVLEGVKIWIKNEAMPSTKITLSPQNIAFTSEAIIDVWKTGVIGNFTNFVFEEGWTVEHAKIAYDELKKLADYLLDNRIYNNYYTSLFSEHVGSRLEDDKNWCGGNGDMLAIAPDGKCYPCIRFMKYSLSTPGRKEQPVGDIYSGLDNKDENEWLCKLKSITMSSQSTDKCNNCEIAQGCSLCTGYNYDKFGDPNVRATYICQMHQARVLANHYYWNKLYKQLNLDKKFILNIPKEWALEIISKEEYEYLKLL